MPIYEYRCDNGHTLEVLQRMADDPLASCTACEAPVRRVFHPIAVHFKGSGFYTTDYGKNKDAAAEESKANGDPDASSKSSTDSSKDSKPAGSEAKGKPASSEAKSKG